MLFSWDTTSQQQDHFIGKWENEDRTMIIEIYSEEQLYNGCIISLTDRKCQAQIDKIILIQMNRNQNILFGGTFIEVGKNSEYEARIKLVNDTTFIMKIYCGLFRQKQKWHKLPI